MARDRARVLVMADALRDSLALHAAENPDQWLVVPATFARGIRNAYINGPYPVVVVSIDTLTPGDGGLSDEGIIHRVNSTLKVYGLVQDDEDAEAAALELEADLYRAINANPQLLNGAGEPTVECGYVKWAGSQIRHEPLDQPGLGECEITIVLDHHRATSAA